MPSEIACLHFELSFSSHVNDATIVGFSPYKCMHAEWRRQIGNGPWDPSCRNLYPPLFLNDWIFPWIGNRRGFCYGGEDQVLSWAYVNSVSPWLRHLIIFIGRRKQRSAEIERSSLSLSLSMLFSSRLSKRQSLNRKALCNSHLACNLFNTCHSTLPPGQVVLKFEPPKTQVGQ